jgi:hypothetical protein
MSIWLSIALIAYSLGVIVQWLQFRDFLKEFDEYINFPIVWFAKVITAFHCLIKALIWPYSLILND